MSAEAEAPRAKSNWWLALFALPMVLGTAGRLIKGGWWLNDFDAVICAAWRNAHNLPIYAEMACPGGRPAAFVYLPHLAWALTPFSHGDSVSLARAFYAIPYAAALGFLFWALYARPIEGAPRRLRIPNLVLIIGSALSCGNLAAPCHALVTGAALKDRTRAWWLAAAIVAVSLIKPVFLTYLLIFAYQPDPWPVRARRIGLGLGLAAIVAGVIWATGGEALQAWRASLDSIVLDWQTGVGFLDDVARLGLRGEDPFTQVLFLAFAGLMALAGLAIAEGRQLGREGRLFLAIGLAQLTNPRLMDYDLIMLAPAMAIIVTSAATSLQPILKRALIGSCILALLLNLAELTRLEIRLIPAIFAALVLTAAVGAAWPLWRNLQRRRSDTAS